MLHPYKIGAIHFVRMHHGTLFEMDPLPMPKGLPGMADEPDKPQAISDPVILPWLKKPASPKRESTNLSLFWAGAIGRRSSGKPDCSVEIAKPSTDHPIAALLAAAADRPRTR